MRARYYNTDIKRFINRDVVNGSIENSQSLNKYSYVQGNPVKLTDPFGLSPVGGDPYSLLSTIGHTILDVAGIFFDGADIINALWYAAEGNTFMAATCALAAIPVVGSLVFGSVKVCMKGSKAAYKASKLIASSAAGSASKVKRLADTMYKKQGIKKAVKKISRGVSSEATETAFVMNKGKKVVGNGNVVEEMPSDRLQYYIDDLSHITGKAASARQKAITAIIKEDFPDLHLTYKPEYSPFIRTGIAKHNAGTQIGKNMFVSRNELRDTIIHEELHHRWWKKGVHDHHPVGTDKEKLFYETIRRYKEMRGWN